MKNKVKIAVLFCVFFIAFVSGCVSTGTDEAAEREARAASESSMNRAWRNILANDWDGAEAAFKDVFSTGYFEGSAYGGLSLVSFAGEHDLGTYPPLLAALEKDPGNPGTVALLYLAMDEFVRGDAQMQQLIIALQKAAGVKKLPEWVRREYREALYACYAGAEGLVEESAEIKERLHLIQGFSYLGPFSNVSGSGFKKDFVDIAAQSGAGFSGYGPGLNNWVIKPFERKLPSPGLDIPVSSYFSDISYASLYAYKSLYIDNAGSYTFVFSRRGSIEVWLDGDKVIENGEYVRSNNGFYLHTHLDEGQHHLYVKLNNRENASSFRIAMYPSDERKPDLSPEYVKLFPESGTYDPLLNALCAGIDEGSRGHENRFWLAYMLTRRGWHKAALSYISGSVDENSMLMGWLKARIYRSLGDASAYERLMLAQAREDAFFAPAWHYRLDNYLSNDRLEKVQEVLEGLNETRESWIHKMEAELVLHLKKENEEKAWEVYGEIAQKYGSPTARAGLDMFLYGGQLSRSQADECLSAFANNGHYEQALYLRYTYFRKRAPGFAYTILSEYLSLYPGGEDLWYDYLQLMYDSGSVPYEAIRRQTVDCAASFPFSKSILSEKIAQDRALYNNYAAYVREHPEVMNNTTASGRFREDMGKATSDYRESLAAYVACFPETLRIRDSLREVDDKPLIYEENRPGDSHDIIADFSLKEAAYGECDAVVVYDDRRELFFGDGAYTVFQHYILQVLTDKGVEDNRYQYLEFNPSFGDGIVSEAFLLKDDGSRIYADRAGRKLAFPGLNPGDYLVVRYQVDGYMTGSLNNEIWTSCNLAGQYPVAHMGYQLILPKDRTVEKRFNNVDSSSVSLVEEEYLEDFFRISIEIADVPGIKTGPFPLQSRDVVPWIDFSTVSAWGTIVQWYEDLYKGQAQPSFAIESRTLEVTQGADGMEDKLMRIFDFVSATIEYEDLDFQYSNFVPQTADSVLREGYGDCKDQSVLLISMLKAADIDSYMVLNTPWYRGDNPYLPSPRFSHAIVAVPGPEGVTYLDPTTGDFTYGEIPADMVGSYVLPITEGGLLSRLEADTESQRTFYLLEMDNLAGTASVSGSVSYQGAAAGVFRWNFKDAGKEQSREMFSLLTNTWLPGFTLDSLELRNLDGLFYDPIVNFTGSVQGQVSPAGQGTYRLHIPFVDLLGEQVRAWIAGAQAGTPMNIRHPVLATPHVQTAVLHIPAGYRIAHLPQDINFTFDDSYVKYVYSGKGDSIVVTREVCIRNQQLPADRTDEFRTFIHKAVMKEQEGVYLKR